MNTNCLGVGSRWGFSLGLTRSRSQLLKYIMLVWLLIVFVKTRKKEILRKFSAKYYVTLNPFIILFFNLELELTGTWLV